MIDIRLDSKCKMYSSFFFHMYAFDDFISTCKPVGNEDSSGDPFEVLSWTFIAAAGNIRNLHHMIYPNRMKMWFDG